MLQFYVLYLVYISVEETEDLLLNRMTMPSMCVQIEDSAIRNFSIIYASRDS